MPINRVFQRLKKPRKDGFHAEDFMSELKEIIKNSDRYNKFTLLDEPISFEELFKDENFDCVQLHSTHIFSYKNGVQDIVGFCGVFSWINNDIKSLDGDSYSDNFKVIGYERFTTQDKDKCIDILVDDDW